ncbi:MAG: tetraacyldisaccharide 4'-kinase [Nitrospiraceae bacterium]
MTTEPRWWLAWLAVPYGLVTSMRAAWYRRGWLPVRKLPCRVVSVGNLTVGGTGKTPVVILLTEWLLARGQRVGVLSRGYRRTSRERRLLVSDGRRLLAGPAETGDEPHLIARRCPKAVVAVGADRYQLGRWMLDRFPIDCMILDDGFQHLALHRDVNLLLVDATDEKGMQHLLPAGRLREPLTAAARATAILVTRTHTTHDADNALARMRQICGHIPEHMLVSFNVEHFMNVATSEIKRTDYFLNRRVVAFSGIANPASFRTVLEKAGLIILDEVMFGDHHVYRAADMKEVRRRANLVGAELLVTTEKDVAKIAPLLEPQDRCWAVGLRTDVVEGREQLERLVLGTVEAGERCMGEAAQSLHSLGIRHR